MNVPDLAKLSDADLEAAAQALQAEIYEKGEELQALADERNERGAKARAEAMLDGMAPGDLDVLVQAAAAKMSATTPTPGEEE